jgi:hypothetical protein
MLPEQELSNGNDDCIRVFDVNDDCKLGLSKGLLQESESCRPQVVPSSVLAKNVLKESAKFLIRTIQLNLQDPGIRQ